MDRITYIDGLKGIGTIIVFLNHYYLFGFPFHNLSDYSIVGEWFANGGLAVMLFITISGFLSLKIGLSKSDDIAYIIRNPIRKYLRFVIPFGLAFIILQISYLLGAYNHFDNVFEKSIVHLSMGRENPIIPVSWYELLKAILVSPMTIRFWDGPLWMMCIIFYGSIWGVFIGAYIAKISIKKQFVVVACCSIVLILVNKLYAGIAGGFFIYFIVGRNNVKKNLRLIIACLCFLAACILNVHLQFGHEIRHTLVSMLIIAGIDNAKWIRNILELNVFQFLGKISFSIYIWHFPIICSLSSWLCVITSNRFIIVFPISVIAVIFISYISWKYLEMVSTKMQSFIENILLK